MSHKVVESPPWGTGSFWVSSFRRNPESRGRLRQVAIWTPAFAGVTVRLCCTLQRKLTHYLPRLPFAKGIWRNLGLAAFFAMCVVLLAACGDSGLQVSKAQYGDAWPFAVDEGVVDCVKSSGGRVHSAIFKTGGKVYGLNVVAEGRDYLPLEPIWRNDPQRPGQPLSLDPMIKLALEQC